MIFLFLRVLGTILYAIGIIMSPIFNLWVGIKKKALPEVTNRLINLPAAELAKQIRNQEIKCEDVVRAYIDRIKEVNVVLNAVIDDRFDNAIEDAKNVDIVCMETANKEELKDNFPLLGVPFTVKESCGLEGMSHVVGSHFRKGMRSSQDGEVVKTLRGKGAIPLLVSANPEFCLSWETTSIIYGRCHNPYNLWRTSGGSSGGEGALNGSGSSAFGVGSDLSGSVRIPCLFNGVFGHKPTGGLISIKGHFPTCSDEGFEELLQIGPITRFAGDLPFLMEIFAGDNVSKMQVSSVTELKDLKIHYMDHGWSFNHLPVQSDIRHSIFKAVDYFRKNGSEVEQLIMEEFNDSIGIVYASLMTQKDPPKVLVNPNDPDTKINSNLELLKFVFGKSAHSFPAIFFQILYDVGDKIPQSFKLHYMAKRESLKSKLAKKLGTNGVLLYPTFHCPAFYHNTSSFQTPGILFSGIFNMIGFPATHIPMGLNKDGLPIGFQVVAAPYQDRLCFQVAKELENTFGGWVPPT